MKTPHVKEIFQQEDGGWTEAGAGLSEVLDVDIENNERAHFHVPPMYIL